MLDDAGRACADHQDRVLRNLQCRRLQLDEIWSFTAAKQKNVEPIAEAGYVVTHKASGAWCVTHMDMTLADAAERLLREMPLPKSAQ